MDRNDVIFYSSLSSHFDVTLIGIESGVTSYEYMAKKAGEKTMEDCNITLEEALNQDGHDVLIIPGGPAAGSVEGEALEGVKKLIQRSMRVVTAGWGIGLLANTGELEGKNATADDHYFFGHGLRRWENVNWQRDLQLVSDGKFITAKYSQHNEILALIAPSAELPPAPEAEIPPHPIDTTARGDLSSWQDLIRRLRNHAKHLVETSDAEVDRAFMAEDPFLRPAADEGNIRSAEERLGFALPGDYKDFLMVTNGTGFSGDTVPGHARVEDLDWKSTSVEETGLDFLIEMVDMLPGLEGEITPQERGAIPALQRVLILSDEDDEEIVGMFDPAWIRRASQAIGETRGVPWEEPEEVKWITFLFVPWAASFDQYASFKEYIESRMG